MRYKDVANRLVASPALPIDKKTAFDAVSMAVVVLRAFDTFRLFYMILLLFARVINLIIVIVIVNNFCIVMVRIYNFVENKGIF